MKQQADRKREKNGDKVMLRTKKLGIQEKTSKEISELICWPIYH